MKVALVCDWYHPRLGGIELHLQDLATRLVAVGCDVVVITPTPGADVVDGIRVRRVRAPLAPVFHFLATPGGVRTLGRILAEERPDVAHCHVSIVSPAAIGGAFQAERSGIPVAFTFHSVVPQMRALARVSDRLLHISNVVASFSAVSARVAHDVRPLAGERAMTVVPNGIDVGFWRAGPRRRGMVDDRDMRDDPNRSHLRIVSVMRLNAKKRPLALVDIMKRIRPQLPATMRVSLRIAGAGPLAGTLERAIARADLSDEIELLGRRTREEIRALFAESDVFLLPTVRESFGLAALEARCAGLPVVAMAASGVAEIVRHGVEGLLGRDDADLAAHVASLACDPDRRDAIARHNLTTASQHDWPGVIAANLALYREAIALRPRV